MLQHRSSGLLGYMTSTAMQIGIRNEGDTQKSKHMQCHSSWLQHDTGNYFSSWATVSF